MYPVSELDQILRPIKLLSSSLTTSIQLVSPRRNTNHSQDTNLTFQWELCQSISMIQGIDHTYVTVAPLVKELVSAKFAVR
jgi:hypothetical protein